MTNRPDHYRFHQGDRVPPFAPAEYDARLAGLRRIMAEHGVGAAVLTIPDGQPGAGGCREHDILIITEDGNEDITHYPYGPGFNVVG